ncbi:MAG: NAD(P)H:quinone oxidoreductase, type IV [Firmicutes bacterium HGW-Firmicutes-19]|jgi:NAD(P)H dehydrogenase (quinone)|nr:MAG: NAD(P)H:quinone oxidoreductase, type IV [Firmicutes bacterium HGW-Firmicutes-19]
MSTKLAIVYYSTYGTNLTMAQWAKEAAEKAGAEVRLLKVTELAPQSVIDSQPGWRAVQEATKDIPVASSADLDWADAILFSAPSRFGNLPAQMKQFLDVQGGLWSKGKLANKAVSAMTSAQNPHGGQEATILSLYTTMYHWGAIVVAPGYTDASIFTAGGNPYGTSVSVNQKGEMVEDVRGAIEHQTTRLLQIAEKLK